MSRTETFVCAGCPRKFLTTNARRRHYEWNPAHAATGSRPDDENDRATDADASAREGAVVVERPEERRIDVSAVRSVATERVRWAFDGSFLTVIVPKPVQSDRV